jgi:hypothetical protein
VTLALQAAAVQEAQDGGRRGGVGGHVVGVGQGVVLELGEEEGGMDVRVAVVNVRVVGLSATRRPQGGHGMGASVLTQGS